MAEQSIGKLTLSFGSDVKKSDANNINYLTEALTKLDKLDINSGFIKRLDRMGTALNRFNGIKINAGLGKGIENLTKSINTIEDIKDITPYANNLSNGFKILGKAAVHFNEVNTKLSGSSASGIGEISKALGQITNVNDISPYANNIKNGFRILADSSKYFEGNNATISSTIGRSVGGLVEAINSIQDVKDITPYAGNINNAFKILSSATKEFEGNNAKMGVNLGRSITGLIEATNKIGEVKDISSKAETIRRNFITIAIATRSFNGMDNADYSGISRMITAMTTIQKVKPINDNVIKNAEKLAKAINVLDKDVNASNTRLKALSGAARSVGDSFNKAEPSVQKFGKSMTAINFAATIYGIKRVSDTLLGLTRQAYGTVDAYGHVENTLSFFTNSLGKEASKTAAIIQQYADFGAVDFTQFADQTAKLNQMYRGYGISAEDAAKMALNMTQLAYDASYALGENGKDIELWFQRSTSFATGATRSGYFFGVDASVKALSEEFEGLSSSTDKATRAMASYELILENTKAIQGQLPREFQNTYVQMEVFKNRIEQLKQSIGRALVPAFQTIINYGLTAIKVVEILVDALVKLFGGEGFELINYEDMINDMQDGIGGVADSTTNIGDGFTDAKKKAEELKKTISGIDQVFTINDKKPADKKPSGGGGVSGIGGGVGGYDWLDALGSAQNIESLKKIDEQAQKIAKTIKDAIPYVVTFGTLLLGLKISKALLDGLKYIDGLKDIGAGIGLDKISFGVGLPLLIANLDDFRRAVAAFIDEGANFDTVTHLLSAFTGTMASIFMMMGQWKVAGALFVIQGAIDIIRAVKSMGEIGVNWDNVSLAMKGLSNLVIGIGILKKDWQKVGVGMIMQGSLMIINEIVANWEAIRKGDFSGVDKVTIIIGGLLVLGGLATALGIFKKTVDVANKSKGLTEAPKALETVSTSTKGVNGSMVTLAKNLGMAIIIMAEVTVAAGLFVGAIWLIGELLQKVGEAWAPVIADGKNISIGIALGTTLLVGVGLAAFALGTAAIASGGTIPLAIGAGTAMLVLLGAATLLFIEELKITGDALTKRLHPSLAALNEVMPELSDNMRDFSKFMIEFAGHVAVYTASSAVSGLAGTIDTIIGWFTKDPIKKMAEDAEKNSKQFKALNEALVVTNPRIRRGNEMMKDYLGMLEELHRLADRASSMGGLGNISVNFKSFSKDLRDGFADLDKAKTENVEKIMKALGAIDLNKFRGIGTDIVKSLELGMTGYTFRLDSIVTKIRNGLTFSATSIGSKIATDVMNGINSSSANVTSFRSKIQSNLKVDGTVIGSKIGRETVSGINNTYVNLTTFSRSIKNGVSLDGHSTGSNIGKDVVRGINNAYVNLFSFKKSVSNAISFSSYSIGSDIARGVQNGINGFYPNTKTFTDRLKKGMKVSFEVRSPSRWAKRVIGDMIGAGVVNGVNETDVNFNQFRSNVEQNMDDIDLTPKFEMPTLDTRVLRGNVDDINGVMKAQVNAQYEVDTDQTGKAIDGLTSVTIDLLGEVITAIKEGKVIQVDGNEIGKVSESYTRNQTILSNR